MTQIASIGKERVEPELDVLLEDISDLHSRAYDLSSVHSAGSTAAGQRRRADHGDAEPVTACRA